MFRCTLFIGITIWALLSAIRPSMAVNPDEVLNDPALEARARVLSQELRCVVCQNQSIDDSNAPLAKDLRVLLRERLKAGDNDEAAIDYIVARYGNFVLLRPPMQFSTMLLWFGPFMVLLLALSIYWTMIRKRPATPAGAPDPLTQAERDELNTILEKGRS